MYCNGPYLLSMDVVINIASDREQGSVEREPYDPDKYWAYNDDYIIIRRNFDNGNIVAFGADPRWHSDDYGTDYSICVCKPWTLTSDTLVVHHAHPQLIRSWHSNKTEFALLGKPFRRYGHNLCPIQNKTERWCNWVEGCMPNWEKCAINVV